MERDILGKAVAFFAKETHEVRVHPGGEGLLAVAVCAPCSQVSASGFYAWLRSVPSARAKKDERLRC